MIQKSLFFLVTFTGLICATPAAAQSPSTRPFGTLRDQAAMQQEWLKKRLDTFLPALMRKHGIDMWVVPMREYNEDPVFSSIVVADDIRRAAPHDLRVLRQVRRGCRHAGATRRASSASRSAARRRAASSKRVRSTKPRPTRRSAASQAELWGDEQWQVLKKVIEERKPAVIGIDRSTHVRLLRRPDERRAATA